MNISPIKENICKALAKYQYLTNSQMITLGISTSIEVVRKNVKELSDPKRAFLGSIKYGASDRLGKREYFHYLKRKGVKLLCNDLLYTPEQIKAPKNKTPNITTDYYHRKSTIDFQIALHQHTTQQQGDILFFDTYFERKGSNRNGKSISKTAIDTKQSYLLADALLMIDIPQPQTRKKYLYAFEMHNTNSTKNITEQLTRYLECLEIGSITVKYGFDKGSRILSVFEDVNKMHNTLNRITTNPYFDNMRQLYLFKPLSEILENGVYADWITAGSEVVSLY